MVCSSVGQEGMYGINSGQEVLSGVLRTRKGAEKEYNRLRVMERWAERCSFGIGGSVVCNLE